MYSPRLGKVKRDIIIKDLELLRDKLRSICHMPSCGSPSSGCPESCRCKNSSSKYKAPLDIQTAAVWGAANELTDAISFVRTKTYKESQIVINENINVMVVLHNMFSMHFQQYRTVARIFQVAVNFMNKIRQIYFEYEPDKTYLEFLHTQLDTHREGVEKLLNLRDKRNRLKR